MIWLTCAPESENVIAVRGCLIIASIATWSGFTGNCWKNTSNFDSRPRSIMISTGSRPDDSASSASVGLRPWARSSTWIRS